MKSAACKTLKSNTAGLLTGAAIPSETRFREFPLVIATVAKSMARGLWLVVRVKYPQPDVSLAAGRSVILIV